MILQTNFDVHNYYSIRVYFVLSSMLYEVLVSNNNQKKMMMMMMNFV